MPQANAFQLVAGEISLDLVNTVSWRGDPQRRVERIPTFESLVHWATRAGLMQPPSARTLKLSAANDHVAAEGSAGQVRHLREDLHMIIASHLDRAPPPPEACHRLKLRFAAALKNASASSLPLVWEVPLDSPAALADALAVRAVGLLQSDALHRIGRCSSQACGWVFIDHTRNHGRRWCSSTDCGNRDRAARHYARHRPVRSPPRLSDPDTAD